MKLVIQRVKEASVSLSGKIHAAISQGLLVFVGVEETDSEEDVDWLVKKLCSLRIFSDAADKMQLSVRDISGQILLISQFTLIASTRKGNRPSFIRAAKPEIAIPLYDLFVSRTRELSGVLVQSGVFAATMEVSLVNEGPVTIIIDSKQKE
jgi:D-aminoacyl-tRNA deacylase